MFIFVKPKPGKRIRSPHDGQVVPERGKRVPYSSFWCKRKAEGSVEFIDETSSKKSKRKK